MTSPHTSSARIPTLDGWRGVAIALVLFDHIQDALEHRYLRPWMQTGGHGVTIFFVLSGFLITSKLIERPIDLRRFYLRRFFRLMPAAWVYLAWLLLFDRLTGLHFTSRAEVVSCLLFYRNFRGAAGLAGHFWSLSVEEQFYLIWPVLLLLAGVRRCRWIVTIGALAIAIYRLVFWAHYDQNLLGVQTQVRADALLVGCLLALVLAEPVIYVWAIRWSKIWTIPALAVFLLCIARFHGLAPLHESLAIAALMAASMRHPRLLPFRPLTTMTLAYLGTISYSLYIWQEFFMALLVNHVAMVLSCFILTVCVLASYYCIELPCVRLGHRITNEASHTPGETQQLLA